MNDGEKVEKLKSLLEKSIPEIEGLKNRDDGIKYFVDKLSDVWDVVFDGK
jgi:hypothetical protein